MAELERWLRTPMLVLSFVWLTLVFVELIHPRSHLLESFGTAIWIVFLVDFAVRLTLAPDKLRFFRRNLLTLTSLLVPALRIAPFLRGLRALSAVQGFRIVRIVGTVNRIMNALRSGLRRRKLAFVATLTLVVTLLGAAGMESFEPHAAAPGGSGFSGYGDALWWTAMIMTTLGSQYWPQTGGGRVLGFLLSLYAVGVFGYLTAALSSVFVGEDAANQQSRLSGSNDVGALRRDIAALRAELRAARCASGSRTPNISKASP